MTNIPLWAVWTEPKDLLLWLCIEKMNANYGEWSESVTMYKLWECPNFDPQHPYRCVGPMATEGECAGYCSTHCPWYERNKMVHTMTGQQVEQQLNDWTRHRCECHGHKTNKKYKIYAYTLTTNGNDVAEEEQKLCEAVEKLFRQKSVPIQQGEAYLEYTEQGRPHIHGWYETEDGGRIFAKIFKRCWSLWGETRGHTRFAGGYHEEMKTNRYKNYASAEGRVIITKIKDQPFIYHGPTQTRQEE